MMECCLVNTVEAQMSAAHTQAAALSQGRCFVSVLPEKAMAMQAVLWQWTEGQTLTEASAFQMSCIKVMAKFSRPMASAVGRMSRPLGSTI